MPDAFGPPGDPRFIGPLLFFRGLQDGRLMLAVLTSEPDGTEPGVLTTGDATVHPEAVYALDGVTVHRYLFSLPARNDAGYSIAGRRYAVAGELDGDLRLAYVSCNGRERGDGDRDVDERDRLWVRLAEDHAREPAQLLLQGGDQLYADEMLREHPWLRAWDQGRLDDEPAVAELLAVENALRRFLFAAYRRLYSQPAPAWLMARVPSLCMWDDHDICDGWGSLSARQLDHLVGRAVFRVAREFFQLFQRAERPDEPAPVAGDASQTDSLGWCHRLPGVVLAAPDLRTERRPDRVMGPGGWAAFSEALDAVADERVLVLSSVPALGPRLSWVEAAMRWCPGVQRYEDDLRDQWQSRAHRDEWRRFLNAILAVHGRGGARVTILSGEIHLATRGTMEAGAAGPVHQLVASGIAHPAPPRAYARLLGLLARAGEGPVSGHPIRLRPLPGQRAIYTTQRNYLMVERRGGAWQARWMLEEDGLTPPLPL